MRKVQFSKLAIALGGVAALLSACAGGGHTSGELPSAAILPTQEGPSEDYIIGPSDSLSIFVWRNPDLSTKVQVRPDGRITTPLVTDMPAVGKTTTMLAQDLKIALGEFIKDPIVSVIVDNPAGTFSQSVRIVGATTKPAAIPYRANMTLLDAMIAVGGLNDFAAGNRARLVRFDRATGHQHEYPLKINSLLRHGEASANVKLQPGDVIIIPQSSF